MIEVIILIGKLLLQLLPFLRDLKKSPEEEKKEFKNSVHTAIKKLKETKELPLEEKRKRARSAIESLNKLLQDS